MSIVDLNLDDVVEPQVVEPGEYEVELTKNSVELKESQNGNKYLNARLNIKGEGETKPIFHLMMMPDGGEYDNSRKLDIKRFLDAFELDYEMKFTEGDKNHLIGTAGKTSYAILKKESDEEYGERNTVKRWSVDSE